MRFENDLLDKRQRCYMDDVPNHSSMIEPVVERIYLLVTFQNASIESALLNDYRKGPCAR